MAIAECTAKLIVTMSQNNLKQDNEENINTSRGAVIKHMQHRMKKLTNT